MFGDLGPGKLVYELIFDQISQRIVPCTYGTICVPSHPHEQIIWDPKAGSGGNMKVLVDQKVRINFYLCHVHVRVLIANLHDLQVVQVVEATLCSCAAFADATTLVTGSRDHTVRLWAVQRNSGHTLQRQSNRPFGISLTHIMRAHAAEVICVAASRAWSMVISGSMDGSAVFWDLNRGTYVRSIWHGPGEDTGVHLASINENTVSTFFRKSLLILKSSCRVMSRHVLGKSCVCIPSMGGLLLPWISHRWRYRKCTLPSRPWPSLNAITAVLAYLRRVVPMVPSL